MDAKQTALLMLNIWAAAYCASHSHHWVALTLTWLWLALALWAML